MRSLLIISIFLAGVAVHAQTPTSPSPAPTAVETAKPQATAESTPESTPKGKKDSTKGKTTKGKRGYKTMFAIFDTTMGTIKAKLFFDKAPLTVDNFTELAEGKKEWKDPKTGEKKKSHFYDGLSFHRIIPKFMIQGGDPVGNGTGGPGYQFKDEIYPDVTFDKPGMLAMANAGKDTNGSQFFFTVAATGWLDGKHTIFGEVTEGMDIVKKISEAPRDMINP
jgi:peptidyl-prolyl cis-trans isomerase A (cyclophilin A)